MRICLEWATLLLQFYRSVTLVALRHKKAREEVSHKRHKLLVQLCSNAIVLAQLDTIRTAHKLTAFLVFLAGIAIPTSHNNRFRRLFNHLGYALSAKVQAYGGVEAGDQLSTRVSDI